MLNSLEEERSEHCLCVPSSAVTACSLRAVHLSQPGQGAVGTWNDREVTNPT